MPHERPTPLKLAVMISAVMSVAAAAESTTFVHSDSRIHPALLHSFSGTTDNAAIKAWVFFTDKAIDSTRAYDAEIMQLAATYNARAIERRRDRRTRPGLFDWYDIPVAPQYVEAVEATGADVHVVSRWLNGVSAWATRAQINEIDRLPFVEAIEPVRRAKRLEPDSIEPASSQRSTGTPDFHGQDASRSLDYGVAQEQLDQINIPDVHDLGYTGAGVIIGLLDSGFQRTHAAFNHPGHVVTIVAEWDFVNDDPYTGIEPGDMATQHAHGTKVLSAIGGYLPGEYIGGAFDASFIVCKTEDDTDEYPAEEDNYVGGLEFIEFWGGDIASSSLGYTMWYEPEDMDGVTAPTAIATNVATANGVHCIKSAGNGGHDDDATTLHLDSPADALRVIACGSVDWRGNISASSSDGPSADGRVKPEVVARGVNTVVVATDADTGYTTASGTSFSAPLVASAVGCLLQAHPTWTVDQMRNYLFRSANYYTANGTFEPTYVYGYGLIDTLATLAGDCNGNGIDDETDIITATSEDCNENGVPDECDLVPPGDYHDCNANGMLDVCDLADGVSDDCNANGVPDECDLDCQPNGVPDDCDIADGGSQDTNGNGVPDECDAAPPGPEPGAAACMVADDCIDAHAGADCVGGACYVPKNRYLSVDPTANALPVAYQVELTEAADYPTAIGRTWWVDEPACYDFPNGSVVEPTPSTCEGPDRFGWVARLTASPVTRVWTEVPLHITACAIAPVITYEIRGSVDSGTTFSEPLTINTVHNPTDEAQSWGDVTGGPVPDMPGYWLPPERATNFADVGNAIRTFENRSEDTGFPPRIWIDMEIDQVINLADISFIVMAFEGRDYADIDLTLIGVDPTVCP